MNLDIFLLVVLAPIHIILVPAVLIYEILTVYFNEKAGKPSKLATLSFWVGIVIFFSRALLELTSFGRLAQRAASRVKQASWSVVSVLVWKPLFQGFVPIVFRKTNFRVYNALPPLGRNHIRLLDIHPGAWSENLVLSLRRVSLDENETHFEALSYSWGPSLLLRRRVQANGRTFLITDSVFRALKQLREPDRTRTIWVDSICINQSDSAEKNTQVALMHAIYTLATKVVVWLGGAPKGLDNLVSLMQCDGEVSSGKIMSERFAFQSVLRRRWWSRVWIIQEVALARDVVFRIGHAEIPWATMSAFLQKVDTPIDNRVSDFICTVAEIQTEALSLLELAVRFRTRIASDPRDKIFGLRALARSSDHVEMIKPDYSMAPTEVFACAAALDMATSQSLAPVVLAESSPAQGCSWAVDWQSMTDRHWSRADPVEAFKDAVPNSYCVPLWSGGLMPSIDVYCAFHAAGPLSNPCGEGSIGALALARLDWSKRAIEWSGGGCADGWRALYLTGWTADTIAAVGAPAFTRTYSGSSFMEIISSWDALAHAHWKNPSVSHDAAFQATLVADMALNWKAPLPLSSAEFFERMRKAASSQGIDKPFKEDSELVEDEDVYNLMLACCRARRFIVTASGRFGLGPQGCQPGDLVCAIAGSPVPCVLGQRQSARAESYGYIGQAHLDGAMEYSGDLWDNVKSGVVKLRQFTIS